MIYPNMHETLGKKLGFQTGNRVFVFFRIIRKSNIVFGRDEYRHANNLLYLV